MERDNDIVSTMSKGATKKKEAGKVGVSQFLRSSDDEIKAELNAMINLEYNLHNDLEANETTFDAPLFLVRKTRSVKPPEFFKHDKPPPVATVEQNRMEKAAKGEKMEVENEIERYAPNANTEELQSLLRRPAESCEEKYRVLDARDRLMRAKQAKLQLSMAATARGTCPDMCPEKERLMRESQHQVAAYELVESATDYRINHERAVKQYSRSSADQEEPLPQDLRPVKSLKMTMSYLLHEIADHCQEIGANLGEWYHFLWDRTRGIRKDITQQELCCRDSVELVEQCARFHIVCAERLCAEEASVFDKKINTENLTKCLQTLKYMYHDLRVKGVACENEPEFRAYIILLNLNNGNFMWDVQRLPTFVQKTPEVRFAIEVYSSIESNNYAKFFRLVRKTSYLNACILLRYFSQVRVKALSIMVKAYCRSTSTAFPLYELIDILSFEDENEAIEFSEQVGLNISKDELHIMLNRQNFTFPMSNIEQGRALNVVESKRLGMNLTFGRCIAGKTMPRKMYKGHRPHNSFDAHGYLKSASFNAEDQNAQSTEESIESAASDPYEYTEENAATPEAQTSPRASRATARPKGVLTSSSDFPARVLSDEKRTSGIPHVFKMPAATTTAATTTTATSHSDVFQVSIFAKQVAPVGRKKSGELAPFVSDSSSIKSRKRGSEASTYFENQAAPQKVKTRKSKSSESTTSTTTADSRDDEEPPSSFSKAAVTPGGVSTSVSPKTFNEHTNPFADKETGSALPPKASSNIFGNTCREDTSFGNTATSISIFGTCGKSENSWPDRGSIASANKPSAAYPSSSSAAEERQESEKKREVEREKRARRFDRETAEILEDLEAEIIHDVCSTIVKEEIARINLYERLSGKLGEEILDEYVAEICENTLDREIYVERKLGELSRRTRNRIIIKYYGKWREYSRRKRQQRSALDVTPVWLQRRSVEACAKSLYSREQNVAIENMRRKRFKPNIVDEPPLEFLEPIETRILAGIKENAKALDIEIPAKLYWKMTISWPHLDSRPVLWRLKKIVGQYICPSDYTTEQIIKCYKPNSYETLHISIGQFEGLIGERHLTGIDGLFFVATVSENPKFIVRRLTSTVLSRQKLMPIPVIVVILGEPGVARQNIRINDHLDGLLESGYVSEYTVHYEEIMDEKIILELIQSATIWLTVNKSPPVPLEMDYFTRVLDTCLTDELWHRVLGHSPFNSLLERALADVNFVIDLHNEAVTHLIDIVLDPEALLYTDFPPELKIFLAKDISLPCNYEYFDSAWKKEENRENLERIMNELMLPKWTFAWPINDTMELHKCVARYCQQALVHENYNTVACNVLSNVLLLSGGGVNKTSFVQLFLAILKEKILLLKPEMRVVYNKNHVKHFRTLPWWFKSGTLTNYNEHARRPESPLGSTLDESTTIIDDFSPTKEGASYSEEVAKNYERICELSNSASPMREEMQKRAIELRRTSETLNKTLAEQKCSSRILEEKLERALRESENIIDTMI